MTILEEIFQYKRAQLPIRQAERPLHELQAKMGDLPPARGFRTALASSAHPMALIAEVKRASPVMGPTSETLEPTEVARAYESVGVDAVSVLTDEKYFHGSTADFAAVRALVTCPMIRKDFVVDPYDVIEARVIGADAVLLILAMLSDEEARPCFEAAQQLGLDTLFEVHTESELDRAIAMGADLIGVNNRDLATFETRLETSESLIPKIPASAVAVSESALDSAESIKRVEAAGARAVLIGTAFCQSPDVSGTVRSLMGWSA